MDTDEAANSPESQHIPVLADVLLDRLEFPPSAVVVDATVGLGGHAAAMGRLLNREGILIGLDVDEKSLQHARRRLEQFECRIHLFQANFDELNTVLEQLGVDRVDVILADLGVSSRQLADAQTGMSYQLEGPLDMRMDRRLQRTAADLVNQLPEKDLADLIYQYGQERHSRRIARALCRARREKKIRTTADLTILILHALGIKGPGHKYKIHPATRTFQALRIAVNDELARLDSLLADAPHRLNPGGQIAVISFHSLEDRRVKNAFREQQKSGLLEILTKKPLTADQQEKRRNPRSRSAKLRMARKLRKND